MNLTRDIGLKTENYYLNEHHRKNIKFFICLFAQPGDYHYFTVCNCAFDILSIIYSKEMKIFLSIALAFVSVTLIVSSLSHKAEEKLITKNIQQILLQDSIRYVKLQIEFTEYKTHMNDSLLKAAKDEIDCVNRIKVVYKQLQASQELNDRMLDYIEEKLKTIRRPIDH